MTLTLVAVLCQLVAGTDITACHEEMVQKVDMPVNACAIFGQQIVADWLTKTHPSPRYRVQGYKCAAGDYVLKDNVT